MSAAYTAPHAGDRSGKRQPTERAAATAAQLGRADGPGELPDQGHTVENAKLVAVAEEVLVEPQSVGVAVEHKGGAGGVTGWVVLLQLDHARMTEPLQNVGPTPGGALHRPPYRGVGAALAQIDPEPRRLVQFTVPGQVVGPGRARVERVALQQVRAHLELRLAAANADPVQRGLDRPGAGTGDPPSLVIRGTAEHLQEFIDGLHTVLLTHRQPDPQRESVKHAPAPTHTRSPFWASSPASSLAFWLARCSGLPCGTRRPVGVVCTQVPFLVARRGHASSSVRSCGRHRG